MSKPVQSEVGLVSFGDFLFRSSEEPAVQSLPHLSANRDYSCVTSPERTQCFNEGSSYSPTLPRGEQQLKARLYERFLSDWELFRQHDVALCLDTSGVSYLIEPSPT